MNKIKVEALLYNLGKLGHKMHCVFLFALSWTAHSEEIWLQCCEDIQAATEEAT